VKTPITTINGIDIFKMKRTKNRCDDYFMLKKGCVTIGCYYTLGEAKMMARIN